MPQNRKRIYKQVPSEPAEADLRPHQGRVGYFLREWSSEIDSLIAAARHIRGAVERQHGRRQRRNEEIRSATSLRGAVEVRVMVRPSGPRVVNAN